MNQTDEYDPTRYWSGLAILERLSETGTELTSVEAAALLGKRERHRSSALGDEVVARRGRDPA